jgi:hypothetical protein
MYSCLNSAQNPVTIKAYILSFLMAVAGENATNLRNVSKLVSVSRIAFTGRTAWRPTRDAQRMSIVLKRAYRVSHTPAGQRASAVCRLGRSRNSSRDTIRAFERRRGWTYCMITSSISTYCTRIRVHVRVLIHYSNATVSLLFHLFCFNINFH